MSQKQGDPAGGAYQELVPAWMRAYDIGSGLASLPKNPEGLDRFTAAGTPEIEVVLDEKTRALLHGARPDVAPTALNTAIAADTAAAQRGKF